MNCHIEKGKNPVKPPTQQMRETVGVMFVEIRTTEEKAEAACNALNNLHSWMSEQGLVDDDGRDCTRLTDDCVVYMRDSAPPAYPPMDMPGEGEAVLAWNEIRVTSVTPEMRQQGEELFNHHGVSDIWRQLFGA